jgi:hypothetical protein
MNSMFSLEYSLQSAALNLLFWVFSVEVEANIGWLYMTTIFTETYFLVVMGTEHMVFSHVADAYHPIHPLIEVVLPIFILELTFTQDPHDF